MLAFANFELQPERRRLLQAGEPVAIGVRAFDVLLALAERNDRVVSKSELLDLVWPGLVVEENNLQVQISSLRKLLGPQAIATIPGRGYRFTAAIDRVDGASPKPPGEETRIAEAPTVGLSNLPAELPQLYGRAAELPAVRALIESNRLVTVVGAGGIGKTSLAEACAHQLRGAFDDGIWLVELASVTDPSLVVGTVAGVLHVTLGSETPLESLAQAVRASRMLIVLDNCEHLLDGVAALAGALLRAAPEVRLLATSQEPLRATQEQLYRLDALAVPSDANEAAAREAGAVALFEARARAAQPRFALGDHNLAAVVDICRQLDGIALAIELAAARVPLLGIDGLRARLDDRFRVLTGGARLALRRHQTLRAALDWSHGLLTADEQTVFRRLGIFVGGFGLESAQRVSADSRIDPWDVIDHLGALVDKSLVVAETGEEPRYRLLESSRAFALEKLREADESETAMRNHAEAILAVFERSRDEEFTLASQARLERYLPDLDNVRTALDWAAGSARDPLLHVALAGAAAWIWVDAGRRPEGMRRTRAAIAEIGPGTPPRLEARLFGSWAWLAHPIVGAPELAAMARAVELYRQLKDPTLLFLALCNQARFLPYCGLIEEAERALLEAEGLCDPAWPPRLRRPLLSARSYLYDVQGRLEESLVVGEEILQQAIALNDARGQVAAMINLEQTIAVLGRLEESVLRGRELQRLLQRNPSLRSSNEHFVLVNLNMSLTRLGRVDEALEVARSALPVIEKAGRMADMLEQCGLLAFERGRIADAARLLGRADKSFAAGHFRRDPVEQQVREKLVVSLQRVLAAPELARLMQEGEALSDEEAVRLGLRA